MVCPACGNQVPKGSRFCDSCGTWLGDASKPSSAPAPKPPAYSAPPPPAYTPPAAPAFTPPAAPKKKRRWLLPLIIGLAVVAAAAVFLLWFFGDARAYSKAAALYENGQYAQAEASFRALGDYKDSARQVDECRYQQAKASFDRGNYALAQAQFEALGSYADSADQIKACRYQLARQAFDKGDLEGAAAIFEELAGYSDSADWLVKCRPSPVGFWDAKVNLAEIAGDEMGDMKDLFKDVSFDMTLELREDNTFTLILDARSAQPAVEEALRNYIPQLLEETYGMTVEEFESLTSMSMDDLIDSLLEEIDLSDLSATVTGTYTDDGGKLILHANEGGAPVRGTWSGNSLFLNADEYGDIAFTRR